MGQVGNKEYGWETAGSEASVYISSRAVMLILLGSVCRFVPGMEDCGDFLKGGVGWRTATLILMEIKMSIRRYWGQFWGLLLALGCCALPAHGWGNRGHEMVAYLAYVHASNEVQGRIDQLVALNPCYAEWQAAVAKDAEITDDIDKRAALFMLAVTWPDMIKGKNYDCPHKSAFTATDGGVGRDGKFNTNVPPEDQGVASQNLGYDDNRRHQYWHFIDTPFATDGSRTYPAAVPNAVTELEELSKALKTENDARLNSYDLAWIAHLMGDLHQPLHDAELFSKEFPYGDAGGNFEKICPSLDTCGYENLHSYWDNLPGPNADLHVVIAQAKELDAGEKKPTARTAKFGSLAKSESRIEFEEWSKQAFAIAKVDAYAAPFNAGSAKVLESAIPAEYSTKAQADMRKQIVLAGWRLAEVLETDLKKRPDSCCKMPG